MANINKIKLSGTTYNIQDLSAAKTVELTQAQYDALVSGGTVDPNTFYVITDAQGADLSNYYTKSETDDLLDTKLDVSAYTPTDLSNYYTKSETSGATEISTALNAKQDTLVSGTNIKTINNESILGSGNITIQGGGGSASSAITSGDTNPVQGGVLFDELRIPITSEVETLLEWDNHDEGETTNYPLGCSKIKIYVDESQGEDGNGYQFWETDWESVGEIGIIYNNGNVTVNNYSNVTYTIDGNVVTVNYPSIAADVTKIYSVYDNYWTVKAYTSGIVYEPLIDQVSANTISIQGKQDSLSAGTGIDITDNVISATGGGGGSVNVVQTTGTSTADVMSQDAVTTQLDNKANKSAAVGGYKFGTTNNVDYLQYTNVNNNNIGNSIYYPNINGKGILTTNSIYAQNNYNFQLVETSAITTSISSSSTDAQVPSAKAVHDQLGGMKIVKLTESEYTALVTKDSNTLYVVVPDPSN